MGTRGGGEPSARVPRLGTPGTPRLGLGDAGAGDGGAERSTALRGCGFFVPG